MGSECPGCGKVIVSVARVPYCHDCQGYFDELQKGEEQEHMALPAKKRKDPRKEAEIRMAIRAVLELHGWVVIDTEQGYRTDGSTRVRQGLADLYVMGHGGRSAWIEVKSATGKQTDHQEGFEKDCRAAGIPYLLWRHEDEALAWCKETLT